MVYSMRLGGCEMISGRDRRGKSLLVKDVHCFMRKDFTYDDEDALDRGCRWSLEAGQWVISKSKTREKTLLLFLTY